MMLNRNLEPGQYQIGNFVFGANTQFRVESCDVGAYELNVQDFQRGSADELNFGMDTLKPMPINLTIHALNNYHMPNMAAITKDWRELNFDNDRQPGIFAREWRADDVRHKWGELKPLKICRPKDGTVVRVYGRPGKLAVTPLGRPPNNQSRQLVAEYRRSDTLYYSDFEWIVQAPPNEIKTIVRNANHDMGDAPSWLRFLLIGPMVHPIIQLGFVTVELDVSIPMGAAVEISSYPWARRVIDLNSGITLNARLTQPYLDKLLFDTNGIIEFSWNASGLNPWPSTDDVDFQGFDDATFSSQWLISYMGPGAGTMRPKFIVGQTPNVWRTCIVWDDPNWTDPGAHSWRLGTAIRRNKKTVSDWQRIGFRMAHPAESSLIEEECVNRIIGRSNASGTRYLYWDITYTRVWFGMHLDGTDWILSPPYKINRLLENIRNIWDRFKEVFGMAQHGGPGWDYDVDFGTGDNLHLSTLWINGTRLCSFEPGYADARNMFGPEQRHYGFGMKATQRLLGQSTPGPISHFRANDNWPPSAMDDIIEEMEQGAGFTFSMVYLFWRDAWQTL